MQGMPGEDSEGLIPRSIKKILSVTQAAAREGWKYTLEASFLEIYNEVSSGESDCKAAFDTPITDVWLWLAQTLNDLLRKENSDHHPTLSVHLDADGTVDVHNLTRVKVAESSTIGELMDHASRMRSVGYTSMNARSSRSHSVFTLRIRGTNASRKVVVTGTLNLVDLAGSERLSRSQAEGARLKETQSINKSLSCLSDVFVALSNNAKHVRSPYRPLPWCARPHSARVPLHGADPIPELQADVLAAKLLPRRRQDADDGEPVPPRVVHQRKPVLLALRQHREPSAHGQGEAKDGRSPGAWCRQRRQLRGWQRGVWSSSEDCQRHQTDQRGEAPCHRLEPLDGWHSGIVQQAAWHHRARFEAPSPPRMELATLWLRPSNVR